MKKFTVWLGSVGMLATIGGCMVAPGGYASYGYGAPGYGFEGGGYDDGPGLYAPSFGAFEGFGIGGFGDDDDD